MAKSTLIPQINQTLTLIPSLPNDISSIILSYIPFCFHTRAKLTCKSWYHFFTHSNTLIHNLRKNPQIQSTLLIIFPDDPSLSSPYIFDPTHLAWAPLPRTPVNPHAYSLSNFSAISLGPHLYMLGGSLFDTRSFPLDRPTASSAVFRLDFTVSGGGWVAVAPMITARGSFAAAAVGGGGGGIVVAGGGSRHPMFGAAGSRVGRAERYEVERDEWVAMEELQGYRAGCVGFTVRRGAGTEDEEEFWVMGGYGGTTTIAGVLPVDEQCRDVVVMGLNEGKWREVGEMWGDGQRGRLGKVAVVDHPLVSELPQVFMLDENHDIYRFNMALNSWSKETTIPRKNQDGSSYGFVAIQGELHVISLLGVELSEIWRSRHRKRGTFLSMQIYNPKTKSWRSLVTRSPFQCPLDFKTAVMCTICL
ncbi:hypothetical protein RND81_10G241100 [Saponaria officinalis]|uniref:F-box domain-containing protein n=1 Tax=Saponaria officinalis TaxID=3572 RepID=A0AAW1I5Y2_SAPOF